MTAQRIAKAIAASGFCSRRDAERLIEQGRVTLNGAVLDSPAVTVTDTDNITIDGNALRAAQDLRLWLYHKPPGLVTTARDPQGRPTVFDDLPRELGRVISIGRLDLNSEGLLLLTNNGGFSRALELPALELPRRYHVRVFGGVDPAALADLAHGITIDGVHYRRIEVIQEDPGSRARNQWLQITLYEGKNREIRRVMQALGLDVNRLIRIGYGPFMLDDLQRSAIREVPLKTLQRFCDSIGFEP